jgi:hypothetical protein
LLSYYSFSQGANGWDKTFELASYITYISSYQEGNEIIYGLDLLVNLGFLQEQLTLYKSNGGDKNLMRI